MIRQIRPNQNQIDSLLVPINWVNVTTSDCKMRFVLIYGSERCLFISVTTFFQLGVNANLPDAQNSPMCRTLAPPPDDPQPKSAIDSLKTPPFTSLFVCLVSSMGTHGAGLVQRRSRYSCSPGNIQSYDLNGWQSLR